MRKKIIAYMDAEEIIKRGQMYSNFCNEYSINSFLYANPFIADPLFALSRNISIVSMYVCVAAKQRKLQST